MPSELLKAGDRATYGSIEYCVEEVEGRLCTLKSRTGGTVYVLQPCEYLKKLRFKDDCAAALHRRTKQTKNGK